MEWIYRLEERPLHWPFKNKIKYLTSIYRKCWGSIKSTEKHYLAEPKQTNILKNPVIILSPLVEEKQTNDYYIIGIMWRERARQVHTGCAPWWELRCRLTLALARLLIYITLIQQLYRYHNCNLWSYFTIESFLTLTCNTLT